MSESRPLSIVGGISLITGTCIGAGALALPITTFVAGFWPSIALFVISWFAMCLTELLYLEAVLSLPGEVNILSLVLFPGIPFHLHRHLLARSFGFSPRQSDMVDFDLQPSPLSKICSPK